MPQHNQQFQKHLEELDEQSINPSPAPEPHPLRNPGRRLALKWGLATGLLAAAGISYPLLRRENRLGFSSVAIQTDPAFDQLALPPGYKADVFFRWGDALHSAAHNAREDASDSWQDQLQQAGDNHDGMNYFALAAGRGLLVMNHEYVNPSLHSSGQIDPSQPRNEQEVRKEQAAHGVSIIEVANIDGHWQRVVDSPYNRRISALTPMDIRGPLAGHASMQTLDDPRGLEVLGTLNNCATGVTPWGTFLTCEENWHHYFVNRDKTDWQQRTSHKRYGISQGQHSKNYGWESVDARFDASPQGGYVNEPHRFGWVVEIDPRQPDMKPVKHTAFGRFSRECAALAQAEDGRFAFYSGDDAKGEYIYKFVPSQPYLPGQSHHGLLDDGTLYVARFDANGTGQWLALRQGNGPLTNVNGFPDQASVLLNARAAADLLGATPMDRPEWAAVQPGSRDVFVSLTHNPERGERYATDAVNPRPDNRHGQIVRIREQGQRPEAETFEWELFLIAGPDASAGQPAHLTGNIKGDVFSSPDGLSFDAQGRLWIATDFEDTDAEMASLGCNQLLCADPHSREVKRFLVGPRGGEITGLAFSPEQDAMWVNIQHPGLSFPASDGRSRPRSCTMLITREDGGLIAG